DGDGLPDLVAVNHTDETLTILKGAGHGTIGARTDIPMLPGTQPAVVQVADLNGDGHPDLAVTTGNTVEVFRNFGNGTFDRPDDFLVGTFPVSLAVADLNHDGKPDLVTANNSSANISILINTGDGHFADKIDRTTGVQPTSAVIGDVNGDGNPDIVVSN